MINEISHTTEPFPDRGASLPRERRHGLILVNTGDGKGKTSASLGVAFRALGWNWRVRIIQFFKGRWITGEKRLCDSLPMPIEFFAQGDGFTWDRSTGDSEYSDIHFFWDFAQETLRKGEHDLVVLDEINLALSLGHLPLEPVLDALRKRPAWMHVICTGRNAPPGLIEFADLVSEIREIKHPYRAGIEAQQGIEF